MSRPTLAEIGWLQYVIEDHLRPALESAEAVLADLHQVRQCEVSGCDKMFDARDPRAMLRSAQGGIDVCPACEIEHDAAKARAALAKAEAWERKCGAESAA